MEVIGSKCNIQKVIKVNSLTDASNCLKYVNKHYFCMQFSIDYVHYATTHWNTYNDFCIFVWSDNTWTAGFNSLGLRFDKYIYSEDCEYLTYREMKLKRILK